MTVLWLYLIFCVILVISYAIKVDSKFPFSYWGIIVIALIFLATFRGNHDPDYFQYLKDYYRMNGHEEKSFFIIAHIAHNIGNGSFLFLLLIYSILGVGIKCYAINKYAIYPCLSFLIYISSYFVLHEMIQIRAGIVSGLFLLSLPYIYNGEKIKAIGLIMLGSVFHTSAFLLLPLIFLNPSSFNKKFWILLYFLSICINIIGGSQFINQYNLIWSYIPNEWLPTRTLGFTNGYHVFNEKVNIFNLYILFHVITTAYLVFFSKRISNVCKQSYLYLKIAILSFVIYNIYLPGFSLRASELYLTVSIFLYPLVLATIPRYKLLGQSVVALIAVCWILFYVYHKKIIYF